MTTKICHIGKISIGIFALSYYMKIKNISILTKNLTISSRFHSLFYQKYFKLKNSKHFESTIKKIPHLQCFSLAKS